MSRAIRPSIHDDLVDLLSNMDISTLLEFICIPILILNFINIRLDETLPVSIGSHNKSIFLKFFPDKLLIIKILNSLLSKKLLLDFLFSIQFLKNFNISTFICSRRFNSISSLISLFPSSILASCWIILNYLRFEVTSISSKFRATSSFMILIYYGISSIRAEYFCSLFMSLFLSPSSSFDVVKYGECYFSSLGCSVLE